MATATILPAIPSPSIDLPKAVGALKEIAEVREARRGDPLDRFVSVRDMLTDDAILQRLDSRYYTEAEIATLGTGYVWRDGTKGLTADWDAGAFKITAQQLAADIADGTAPLIITSTTVVTNLNADYVDGQHRVLKINADHTHQTTGAEGGKIDHGLALNGLDGDDHAQYHTDARGDARYYTETELSSTTPGSEGSTLIGFHSHTVHDHLLHITNRGVEEGCEISDEGTLDISWTEGVVWDSDNAAVMTIASGTATCDNNAVNYLYADYSVSTTVLQRSTSYPTGTDQTLVGIVWCQDNDIWHIEQGRYLNVTYAKLRRAAMMTFPSRIVSGMAVSEDLAGAGLDVSMSAGALFHGNQIYETSAQIDTRTTAMVRHFHTATAWDSDTNAEIDTAWYDNGTAKTDCDGGKWFKSVFLYVNGKVHWVYPRVQYSTRAQANAGPIPAIPPGLARAAYLTALVHGTDAADFTSADWIDIRIGLAQAIAAAPVTDHDYLAGVSADDHHAQAHKDEHDPFDGADPLDTAAAAEISVVVAAGVGTSHSLARADHVHAINHGITDNHIVTVDGGANAPVNTDYAAWTANGLEGRDKTQMLTFLNVADGAGVVNFANVNAALAAANADIDVNDQDIENINQLAVGFVSPTYDIESRIAAGHAVWANRVYSDTVSHTPYLYFIKSHSDTPWSNVETIDDDMLGEIKFFGMDTVPGMSAGARIYAQQVGAAGAMVPTELIIDVASDTAERSIATFTYSEITLGTGINLQQANADETHYLGRCVLGWLGSGNEAGFQHRSLDIDGTNYAIQQLNLGATYLNCSVGKNIYFQIGGVTVTNLSELDDLTDGGATVLHTHAGLAPGAHKDTHDPFDGSDALDTANAAEVSVVVAAGTGVSHSFARADHIHAINHGIADNHLVTVDGTTNQPVNTDYAAWTANGLEGRDKTQMLAFLNVSEGAGVVNFTNVNAALAAADATIDLNSQALSSVGAIGCGAITTTGNIVLPANGVIGVTDGSPQIVFDNANNWLEITGSVGIGGNYPAALLNVEDETIDSTGSFYAVRGVGIKTAGATNYVNDYYGANFRIAMDQNGGEIGQLIGGRFWAQLKDGTVGASGHDQAMRGFWGQADLDAGYVYGDVYGIYASVDIEAAVTGISGDVFGLKVWVDADKVPDGTTYMLYLEEYTNINYGIYQDGTAPHYLQGKVGIGTGVTAPAAQLHVDQSSTTGAIPVVVLDQADIDLEFIKFIGSSEDGQADRSLVDAVDMTTPGALVGWFQINVEDVQGTNPIADGVYYVPFYAAPAA